MHIIFILIVFIIFTSRSDNWFGSWLNAAKNKVGIIDLEFAARNTLKKLISEHRSIRICEERFGRTWFSG